MRFTWVFLLISFTSVESARILVSQPFGSKSHQNAFVSLVAALSRRGHHVTYVTNYLVPDLSDKGNVTQLVLVNGVLHGAVNTNQFRLILNRTSVTEGFQAMLSYMFDFPVMVVRSVFQDPQIQSLLANEHFDLVLVSQAYASSGYALAWHFKVPFILVSPNTLFSGIATVLGDSEHTEYVPFILSPYTDQMTLTERLFNTLLTYLYILVDELQQTKLLNAVREVLPDCPHLREIEKEVSMVFTNSHPVFSYPRVLPPQIIEIGAIHCRPAKPLALDLERFVSTKEGFIVFSVGSAINMSDMPEELMQSFVNVFSRLDVNVIWQWRGTSRSDLPTNVKTLAWLPQQDLLGHRKCRLFLTHGGINSLQESVYHEVPVLGLPMGADQELNLFKAQKEGYALKLDWKLITEETLSDAIGRLLNDSKYSEAVGRRSALLRDQMKTPLERAVFWTEHVLRHNGTSHLQLGSRYLSTCQRRLMDVYALMVVISSVPCILLGLCLHRCCCGRKNSVDATKKNQ